MRGIGGPGEVGVAPSRRKRPRSKQRALTIRADHSLKRVGLRARDGRSQVDIIEEARDRMPLPPASDGATFRAEVEAILAGVPKRSYPTMAEIDAELWAEDGLPR